MQASPDCKTGWTPIEDRLYVTKMGEACPPAWHALKIRSRSERLVSQTLADSGYEVYYPTHIERRRYSDRMQTFRTAAFPGYLFCRFSPGDKRILFSPQVQYVVSVNGIPAAIPDAEIDSLRLAVHAGAEPIPEIPFTIGGRVRVECGPLAGAEGVLMRGPRNERLVVSIPLLSRAVAVEIEEYRVRPL